MSRCPRGLFLCSRAAHDTLRPTLVAMGLWWVHAYKIQPAVNRCNMGNHPVPSRMMVWAPAARICNYHADRNMVFRLTARQQTGALKNMNENTPPEVVLRHSTALIMNTTRWWRCVCVCVCSRTSVWGPSCSKQVPPADTANSKVMLVCVWCVCVSTNQHLDASLCLTHSTHKNKAKPIPISLCTSFSHHSIESPHQTRPQQCHRATSFSNHSKSHGLCWQRQRCPASARLNQAAALVTMRTMGVGQWELMTAWHNILNLSASRL